MIQYTGGKITLKYRAPGQNFLNAILAIGLLFSQTEILKIITKMNLIKTFILWNRIGKDIISKKRTLRLIAGSQNEKVITPNFNVEEQLGELRKLRKIYQENAVIYDNAGYTRIANRLLTLKELMMQIESIVQSWEVQDERV